MKIGVFCPTLNVYGGGEFVAVVIANTLAQNNYDVTFFSNEEINQMEIKKFFGKKFHPSINVIVKNSPVHSRGLLDFYQTIFRSYIFRSKCDMIIDVYSNCVFPWNNISYIHFPQFNHYLYKPNFPYLKGRYLREICVLPYVLFEKNLVADEGKLILANSSYTAEEIRKFSGKKAEVLYPPVPSLFFDKNSSESQNKHKRKDLVVTISRFGFEKELHKIPYIASLVDKSIEFAIMGRLHCQNTLKSLQKLTEKLSLTDRVKFLPDISIVKMVDTLKSAKIYLHTMVGEHFGISIVQAMATGCIPIVHDSGGPKEFLPPSLRYNTIQEAATKITKEIYEWSPKKAEKIRKISERFNDENFSKRFLETFERYVEASTDLNL